MTDGPSGNDGTRTAITVAIITAVGGVIAALIPIVININAQNSVVNVGLPVDQVNVTMVASINETASDITIVDEAPAVDEASPVDAAPVEEGPAPESENDGLLLSEDFEGDFDIADWIISGNDDDTVIEVVDDGTGNHVMAIKAGEWYVEAARGSRSWENYVFEVRGQLVDAGNKEDNGSGLPALTAAVRVNYTADCWRALRVIMDSYNIFSARSGGASEDCQWELFETFDPYFPAAYGRWYDLRVEVFGSLLRAYVNGELAQEFTFEDLESGHIAVMARGDTTVYYDDIRVTELAAP